MQVKHLRTQLVDLTGKLRESKMKTDALNDKLQNKDKLFRENLLERLTNSDQNVKIFLGLPGVVFLMGLFNILKTNASKMKYWTRQSSSLDKSWQQGGKRKPGKPRKLTLFQEFTLTLLRLRLGLNTYVLGMLFGISQSIVSSIFTSWISFMEQELSPLLKWPSREKIDKHMPLSFKRKYQKTRVIKDATEFFVQRPRNSTAQSHTWSNYKSKNTFKALVGITPNGAIYFVSDLWSENISDRCITEKSGFLDYIERGDHVMAERGFLIIDLLLQRGAYLNMPPFTRACNHGKGRHLTSNEIKQAKNIASLRIHVERAIQRLKSYQFLSGTMYINSISVANQALKVSAIFCNFMKPLVNKVSK